MTEWVAVVPLKAAGERKTRLADLLSAAERATLSRRMFAHVAAILQQHAMIGSVAVLSDQQPDGWCGAFIMDEGRGLNTELEVAREKLGNTGLLVIHADLPLLEGGDIAALIAAAEESGIAIAPDRHGSGTNALALMSGRRIEFRFGTDSFRLHREQAPDSAVIARQGFAIDLDTPDDLKAAAEAGFRLEE